MAVRGATSERASGRASALRTPPNRSPLAGATIFLAPVLVVLALRLPLINQLDYADAWFYSAYAWVPKHHFELFGLNYFAVRFPAVLSIGAFENVFGPNAGYIVLRYFLAVATGGSLYLLVRRFATAPVAIAATLLLYLNPFFSRMLLWDYSYFVVVSLGLVGIALWWWSEGRHRAWSLLAGAALAAAVFAHAVFATVVFVLVAIELVAAVRGGRAVVGRVITRLTLCLAGAMAMFVVGWLAYLWLLGNVGPDDMLRPTIAFLRDNDTQVAPFVQPTRLWLWHEPRIWAPVVLSVALVAVLRRRLLGVDLPARIAQLCIGFTAFVWLYRFAVTSSFIETWWSYHITVVVMAPAVGVLIHVLATEYPRGRRWAAAAILPAAVTALVIRDAPWAVRDFFDALNRHSWMLMLGLALALASALLTGTKRSGVAAAAFAALVVGLGVMTYAPDVLDGRGGTGIFTTHGDRDWVAYGAGHGFIEFVRDHDHPNDRVFLWYPDASGYPNISWADLPQYGQTVQVLGRDTSVRRLDALGVARLKQPQVGSVLVMSPHPGDLGAAQAALSANGFRNHVEAQGRFADGHLPYALVRLISKP